MDKDNRLLAEAYERILIEQITDDWFQQGAFIAYKKPAKEPYEVAQKDGVLQTLEDPNGQPQQYKAGFYIMTGPKGEKYSMPPEKFKELKDDNGDGTVSPKKINKQVKLADSDGVVKTSWGADLEYKSGEDYIVKHGPGDYGVVKKDIFADTYVPLNKVQENFKDGVMQDDKGVKRSVEAVVKFAEKNKDKYFQKDFPISKLEKELKWWDKQNEADKEKSDARMRKADTSFPLLVIKNASYGLSVSDGLNRLKKARDIEKKDKIDVYIVPEEDIPESTIIK